MFLAFVAMFLLAGTASAQNGSTQVNFSDCGALYNPCCDEWVDVCLDWHYTIDKNGQLKHVNVSGGGETAGGTKYNINAVQNQHVNINANGAGNYTLTLSEKFNATGNSDCTLTIHYTIHVTINANGTVTSEVENIRFECENGTIL
jgi:hypothetical protein